LGEEVRGQRGAGQAGDTSIAEDGLESSAGMGTRVEGPNAGGDEGEEGVKHEGHKGAQRGRVEGVNLHAERNN
jgi:hypothetical protein